MLILPYITFALSIAVVLFMLILLFLGVLNNFSSNTWFCRVLHKHKTPNIEYFNGEAFTGICPRCKKSIVRTSNGDWHQGTL
jgi:hypothetical protein